MTRDIIIQLLERKPFKPLKFCLTNNDQFVVDDPANAEVGRNYMVVSMAGTDAKRTITLHHVLYIDCENTPIEKGH